MAPARHVTLFAVFLAASNWGATTAAQACSCLDDFEQASGSRMSGEQINDRRFDKASDVVGGKFVSMSASAGERAMAVHGTMQITKVLKGNLSGAIDVYTGFGPGDCGVPGIFLASIALDEDVQVSVDRAGAPEGGYVISMCGYLKVPPAPKASGGSK
jgi:hypothetical protein